LFTSGFSGNIALVLNVRNCHGLLLFVSLINIFFFSGVSTLETFGGKFSNYSVLTLQRFTFFSKCSKFIQSRWMKETVRYAD